MRLACFCTQKVSSSPLLFSPPQWLVPHHFGGSFSCYDVSIYSLRGVGFNGFYLVSTI